MPVVTTLHTVLLEPNADQRRVMQQLAQLSARLVVMSARGERILREVYKIPAEKIDLIPHGIPDMPFVDPNFYKDQFDVEGKNVLLTFGLLSPNKGIEYVLKALPQVLRDFPETVYIVLGATHPNLVREQGENYRLSLERLTRDLGIKKNVVFYNRFVELHELTEFIGAADIYITPYLNKAQITSGTLAYCVRLRQGGHLDALLARRGAAGRGPRRARAVRRQRRHRRTSLHAAPRRDAPPRDAQAGLHAGPRDDLEQRRRTLHVLIRTGAAQLRPGRPPPARDPHARRAAARIAPRPARSSAADDRLLRHFPARDLRDSQFSRRATAPTTTRGP